MFKPTNLVQSPATPAAILLYGIVFGFAIWSYLGWQWQRHHTIVLYGSIAVWAMVVTTRRWRSMGLTLNPLDILFGAFLLWVLGSVATHWWKGTIQYLEYMPFFVILPYALGRTMDTQDVQLFKRILIGMGGVLLLLMPFEYWKNSQPGFLYVNSPNPVLFDQGHGVMLSGLLFSATLLALISKLISPAASQIKPKGHVRLDHFLGYLMLAALALAMIWISSRGSVVAVTLGIIALLLSSSFFEWRKKLTFLLYMTLITVAAIFFSFQNKHHKDYYQQLFVPPSVTLNEVPRQALRLEYGKPILGEATCKKVSSAISDRWIHYRTAWEIFLAKPWTGVGANSYGFYSCTGPGWFPHTTILQVLAELGVLGALLYLPLLGLIFYVPIKQYKSKTSVLSKANMSWLLAFVILQFTTSQFNGNYFMSAGLYFVMGLAASFFKGSEQNREEA